MEEQKGYLPFPAVFRCKPVPSQLGQNRVDARLSINVHWLSGLLLVALQSILSSITDQMAALHGQMMVQAPCTALFSCTCVLVLLLTFLYVLNWLVGFCCCVSGSILVVGFLVLGDC